MTEIPPINQTISAVQPVLHRDTIDSIDPATQDAYVQSVEAFFDKISETTVEELNTLAEELDASIVAINTVAVEIDTARDEAIAARDEAAGAIAVLENGTINDTVIGANKAYSNLKVNDLLDKREDKKGTSIVSATTITIGTDGLGDYIHITGTTTITSFGTAANAGLRRTLIFDGALTITNGANLICPGLANIATVANTIISVVAETTTQWRIEYVTHPSISFAELGYLDGVTSAIQAQLNVKAPLDSPAFTNNPTAPTQTAGNNSTRLATTAFATGQDLGVGQTWQDVTASRVVGTTYTNTSGKPIEVVIVAPIYSSQAFYISINGVQIVNMQGSGPVSAPLTACIIVPNGQTYKVDTFSTTISKWFELR